MGAERGQLSDDLSFNSELGCLIVTKRWAGLVICREMESSRLPTRVNLSRRGVLLDSHLCPLCNAAMEDVQHVFFRCDVARVVLRKICRWWDLDWQEICSFSDWDAWFLSFRLSSRLKSILEVPLTVLRSLESIRCQFFNGHDLKSNKSSWVKWNSVLAAKEKGGLGVSSLFALNRALLMKWFWRFYSHNDSLWSRVIKAIYGVDGEVNKVSKYATRSCWRDIINEVRKLKDQGINMRDFMYIKVGNGKTTKFWDDIWIGSKPLKLLFPRIYALDNIKDASICMKLNEPSLDNNFRRSIRGGIEQSQFKKLTDLLIPIVLNPCPDRWFWSLEGSGEFSVASIRRFIDDQRLLTVDSKTLWIKSVPIKVNILAWKIKLEALPTRFNISRRGIEIDSILCPICDRGVESTRHIFFSCCLVRQIARKICSWWDIEYSDVNSFTEWINWMASLRLQSKVKMMIQGVFFVVWWLVWSYRNKLLFEEKKPSKAIIFDDVVSISFYWCKSRCKASFSWDDWLKNPSLISL
ncbi:RNA-directed DNA polymerase, eukaryota, reverse transcriptase zinc-binding domain protein [Tanacetum coccineum]